jgi:hypothetical protein
MRAKVINLKTSSIALSRRTETVEEVQAKNPSSNTLLVPTTPVDTVVETRLTATTYAPVNLGEFGTQPVNQARKGTLRASSTRA